jgi:hypothetical protein
MDLSEVTFSLSRFQLVNLLVALSWLILVGLSLWSLRHRYLSDEAKVLWAALILVIPFWGAIALWLVVPNRSLAQAVVVTRKLLSSPGYREPRRAGVDGKGMELGHAAHGSSPT